MTNIDLENSKREGLIFALYCFKYDIILNDENMFNEKQKSLNKYTFDPKFHKFVNIIYDMVKEK